jgi:peptidoglycan/xylan/chitin deacetylase (PgdA/CDA1 family)
MILAVVLCAGLPGCAKQPGGSGAALSPTDGALAGGSDLEEGGMQPHMNREQKMLALTFDDGPSSYTTEILDVLERNNARATFFCLGSRAEEYEKTLRRAAALGCEIASHSYAHKRLSELSGTALAEDLRMARDALEANSGREIRLMRTPYGQHEKELIRKIDMPVVLWDIDTLDWTYGIHETGFSAEEFEYARRKVVQEVLDHAEDGDIVLMHDLYAVTAAAAKEVIALLAREGWQLVTVSELFAAKEKSLEAGKYYCSAR